MTILNVHITRNRALLGADSTVFFPSEKRHVQASKFLVLPRAATVVGNQGSTNFLNALFAGLHGTALADFDQIRARMSELLGQARTAVLPHIDEAAHLQTERVIAIGPSRTAGGLAAFSWVYNLVENKVETRRLVKDEANSWSEEEQGPCPYFIHTDHGMMSVALLQAAYWRQKGTQGIGGRMMVCEILCPDGGYPSIAIRTIGDLDNQAGPSKRAAPIKAAPVPAPVVQSVADHFTRPMASMPSGVARAVRLCGAALESTV